MQRIFSDSTNKNILKVNSKEVLALLGYLEDNLKNFSLRESLYSYSRNCSRKMKFFLINLLEHIEQGKEFTEYLGKFDLLPIYMYQTLLAAEKTGNFQQGLEQVLLYHRQIKDTKRQIVLSLFYPCLILLMSILTGLLFLFWFIPLMTNNFVDLGIEVPPLLKVLNNLSLFLSENYMLAFSAVVLLSIGIYFAVVNYRKKLIQMIAAVPGIRKLFFVWERYQFFFSLKIALSNNHDIISALGILKSTLLTGQARQDLARVTVSVHEGKSFAQSLESTIFYSPEIFAEITKGEHSQQILAAITRIEDNMRSSLDTALKLIKTFVEPAVIVLVGMVVFFILWLFLLPINSLIGNMGI